MAVRASIYIAASHVEARITPHSMLGRNVSRQYNEKLSEVERWTRLDHVLTEKEIRQLVRRGEDSDDAAPRQSNECVGAYFAMTSVPLGMALELAITRVPNRR